ncbi:MAG: HAMP domain-containing protein, partial [Ilumatobacter fluminis]
MRRLKLSQKMLVAALPLVIAVAALLALTVRSDLDDINSAENGADLGAIWQPLTAALTAIENEADPTMASDTAARRATDAAINELRDEAAQLGAAEAAGDHITASRSALSAARRNLDMVTIAPDLQVEIDPLDAYAQASRELVSVGQLLPSEAGDPDLGRELLAVVKLAEAKLAADIILHDVATWQADPSDLTPLSSARNQFAELEAVLGEFEAIAPEDWQTTFRESGFTPAIARERSALDSVIRSAQAGENPEYDPTEFAQLVEGGVAYQVQVADSIVERADAEAAATRSDTLRRTGIVIAVGAVAVFLAWLIARSITKRIKAVAKGANQVTTEQLPALVTAINDPKGKGKLPEIDPIPVKGNDELNELAESFNSLQDTLVDVAQEQMEV